LRFHLVLGSACGSSKVTFLRSLG